MIGTFGNAIATDKFFEEEKVNQQPLAKKSKIMIEEGSDKSSIKVVKQSAPKQLSLFQFLKPKTSELVQEESMIESPSNFLSTFISPILSGFDFSIEGPVLIVDELGKFSPTRHRIPIWDQPFSFELGSEKYCIGRYDIDTFDAFPCAYKSAIQEKFQNCYKCYQTLQFNPAFYNSSPELISEKQKKYNLNPHNVYLAYFAENAIKVGTAHYQRTERRLLEQGARAAVILKRCQDAYEARELEEFIFTNYPHITEGVSSVQKKKYLKSIYNPEEAFQVLKQAKQQVSEAFLLDKEEVFYDWQDRYIQSGAMSQSFLDISSQKEPQLRGKGIGLIGDSLVIKQSTQFYVVSLNKFLGRILKIIK